MMHSRGFVLSENQAFAGQTRTPGPSRLHASPTRKNMTTGKRALGGSSNPFGAHVGSAGPKQLFQDLMSKSPVKALGDRNAAKTPGPSKSAPGKQEASIRKDNPAPSSPAKKGSELSPRKATTSNALRSINGKQRQTSEHPFTKPGQSSTNDAGNMINTPTPSKLGKTSTMSRQNRFITPAANVGRAGQIKARMGEMMDAEMGVSLQKADNATEHVTEQSTVRMTEEEMYPEIEYMPPSTYAKHPVFEFPEELDDLPRAKELGAKLSRFTTIGLRAAGPGDLSDVEVPPMDETVESDIMPPTLAAVSDDDDPWPDVPVPEAVTATRQPCSIRSSSVVKAAKSTETARNTTAESARPPLTRARPPTVASTNRLSTKANKTVFTSSAANARTTAPKAINRSFARSTGLQRSLASASDNRAPSSSTSTSSRVGSVARSSGTATARTIIRPSTLVTKRAVVQGEKHSVRGATQPVKSSPAATMLNPKLIDFVDDELGKQTAAALDRFDAEQDIDSLQLDLDDVSDAEA
ncbi:uncharacterized protein MEPE_03298 [Melanopsichium pennsylvanicum]|uniref:Uncharacterized protein n=2 Tax=Melanopsichium pennsylvanicum TaxID=63383 RepID=A0AAJ4XLK4_9BASI|nr:conserved hypothetical protein [Melanopsichium pennsylvanicum 4]SNX84589.1 uncharacterized protein MEPE_03298 [Melanopsichium pennsylvanicum]